MILLDELHRYTNCFVSFYLKGFQEETALITIAAGFYQQNAGNSDLSYLHQTTPIIGTQSQEDFCNWIAATALSRLAIDTASTLKQRRHKNGHNRQLLCVSRQLSIALSC